MLSNYVDLVRLLTFVQGYYGAAAGKGRQSAKGELEKLDLASPTCALTLKEAVMEAARIVYVAHEDSKDKEFELEMTWISTADGPTKGRHMPVPQQLLEEADKAAKKSLENDDEEEDDEEGGDAEMHE
jgi:20S proteasome subunit alpha 7